MPPYTVRTDGDGPWTGVYLRDTVLQGAVPMPCSGPAQALAAQRATRDRRRPGVRDGAPETTSCAPYGAASGQAKRGQEYTIPPALFRRFLRISRGSPPS